MNSWKTHYTKSKHWWLSFVQKLQSLILANSWKTRTHSFCVPSLISKKYVLFQINYLGTTGGENVTDWARRIMKCIIKTELAAKFNWKGKGDNHAFGILITCAVVKCNFVINWLIVVLLLIFVIYAVQKEKNINISKLILVKFPWNNRV